jgi:hypothetical protein
LNTRVTVEVDALDILALQVAFLTFEDHYYGRVCRLPKDLYDIVIVAQRIAQAADRPVETSSPEPSTEHKEDFR